MRWPPKHAAKRSIRKSISVFSLRRASKTGGCGLDGFDATGGKPDEVEAKTGIERIAECRQLLAEKPFDDRGGADGCPRFDGDAPDRAIATEEHGFKAAGAFATLFENVRETGGQGFERRTDRLFHYHRLGEACSFQ